MTFSTHTRHQAVRGPITIVAVVAVVLLLASPGVSAREASPRGEHAVQIGPGAQRVHRSPGRAPADLPPRARRVLTAAASQKKAVIVVGPVGSATTTYLAKARAIADAARTWGMDVVTIYPPDATWGRVVGAANGADLFVYLGHGNGWPSPHPPFQEDSKDGLGLNPHLNDTNTYDVKYYGADLIREQIRFAPNAIVLLNKLCYADGNGEEGMPIPSLEVARQRVENFASGFLDSGARVVFALGWQPGENLVNSLFSTTPTTMDGFFQTRFGANRDGSYKPYYGWIGWKPDLYFDSTRNAGARLHLDPGESEGYLRAVTGDLEMTSDQWLGNVDPEDTDPPAVSDLAGDQAADTIASGEDALPVFTPNGDGLSDRMTIHDTVSEGAFLKVQVQRSDDTTLRTFSRWAAGGPDSFVWDGRDDAGKLVRDGRYDVVVTPKDRAGNVGDTARTSIRLLTSMKSPTALPLLFYPSDGDLLAPTTTLGIILKRDASITWRIADGAGEVIRHGMVDQPMTRGPTSWAWDGLDDSGTAAPDGRYTAIVTATTAAGTYSHRLRIRLMPFQLKAHLRVSSASSQTITLLTAEPVAGWPRIEVKQPGLAAYRLHLVRYSPTRFTARWVVRPGGTGTIRITLTATDTSGGVEVRRITGRLK